LTSAAKDTISGHPDGKAEDLSLMVII